LENTVSKSYGIYFNKNRGDSVDIILKSEILEIVNIKKNTKAEMFKDLLIGDKIMLSIPVKYAGGNRGTYASYIKVENLQNGESVRKSFNQIGTVLDIFEFKTV